MTESGFHRSLTALAAPLSLLLVSVISVAQENSAGAQSILGPTLELVACGKGSDDMIHLENVASVGQGADCGQGAD
jgi:hypothetical protein